MVLSELKRETFSCDDTHMVPSFINSSFTSRVEYDAWVKEQAPTEVAPFLPKRTKTDAASGVEFEPNLLKYPGISAEELRKHFDDFQELDVEESGLITADSLLQISQALVFNTSKEELQMTIREVFVLLDKEDDGQLSFRDYSEQRTTARQPHPSTYARTSAPQP